MNMLRRTTIFTTLFFVYLVFPHNTSALTLSPARFEIETDAGNTASGVVTLLNEQEETKTFYSSFENFEASGESGTPNFVPGNDGLASWISAEYSVTLAPGEEREIPFTIRIPSETPAGGYFAALFWGTTPPTTGGGDISVGARIGMLVLLRVSGEVVEDGGISKVDTETGEMLFDALPVKLTYLFHNNGGDRLNPTGTVVVRNLLGIKVAELDANSTQGNVLPGSSRKFSVVWGRENQHDGFFGTAWYQLQHFAIGPYKVTASVVYGTNETSDKASAFVWFFPWQILTLLLIGLLIAWIIFVKIVKARRRMLRRQRQLEAKIAELERQARRESEKSPERLRAQKPPSRFGEIKKSHTIKK